jgi:hypothetical protein
MAFHLQLLLKLAADAHPEQASDPIKRANFELNVVIVE